MIGEIKNGMTNIGLKATGTPKINGSLIPLKIGIAEIPLRLSNILPSI